MDQRVDARAAVELLRPLGGLDPRGFQWDRDRTVFYSYFAKLQFPAGIHTEPTNLLRRVSDAT
jgi:hypothetical protein